MKIPLILIILISAINVSTAQSKVSFVFADSVSKQAVSNVTINANEKNIAVANELGKAIVTMQNGNYQYMFSSVNYKNQTINIDIKKDTLIHVLLIREQENLNDIVVVSTLRNNQPIENAPIKIEVLGKEEINEESTIKPASIASILGDVSGVQVLQTAAT